MLSYKKVIIIQVLLILTYPVLSQRHDRVVKANIIMETLKDSNYYDKNVIMNLLIRKNVVVPEIRNFGLDDDVSGFYNIELQKKSDIGYIPYAHSGLYNPTYQIPPILDSMANLTVQDSFYLGEYYANLKKGLYRMKILAFINQYNNQYQNKSTPWFYFELIDDLKPYLFRNLNLK